MLDPKIGAEELTNISGYQMLSADKYLKSYLPPTKLIKKLAHTCANTNYPANTITNNLL
jgi:hypothetical protein